MNNSKWLTMLLEAEAWLMDGWLVGWWTGMSHEMGARWDPNPEHH